MDVVVDKAASTVRDLLSSSPWIPDSVRPTPHPVFVAASVPPATVLEKMQDWVLRHKLITGVAVIATGTISYRMYRNNQSRHKTRRARRSKRNGGRMDVLVIAGSPALPLTRSLALDMERKGFIVFVICNSVEDEHLLQHLSRPDIRPLSIDVTDVSACSRPAMPASNNARSLPVPTRPSTGLPCSSKPPTFPSPWPNQTISPSRLFS
jgi:hypothetical protein